MRARTHSRGWGRIPRWNGHVALLAPREETLSSAGVESSFQKVT